MTKFQEKHCFSRHGTGTQYIIPGKKTGQNKRNSISLKPQRNGKSYFISQHTCKATAHPVGSRATGASPQQAKTQRVQSICIPPSLAPYEQQAPPRQD